MLAYEIKSLHVRRWILGCDPPPCGLIGNGGGAFGSSDAYCVQYVIYRVRATPSPRSAGFIPFVCRFIFFVVVVLSGVFVFCLFLFYLFFSSWNHTGGQRLGPEDAMGPEGGGSSRKVGAIGGLAETSRLWPGRREVTRRPHLSPACTSRRRTWTFPGRWIPQFPTTEVATHWQRRRVLKGNCGNGSGFISK